MKYIFLSFTGASFCIAKRLVDEGEQVLVGQIHDPQSLRTKGWQSAPESPEARYRRLSLYNGMLTKIDAAELLRSMRGIANQRKCDEYFVVLDHNNLCWYGEKILEMGFSGLIPNYDDYDREKDRVAAHEFVKTYYDDLHILPSCEFKKASDGVSYVESCADLLVLKSNGNFGNTVVPQTKNVELNHLQIIGALTANAADYEKGGFLLETKIADPIEFAPVLAFWDGQPIYAHVEFESKPLCAGDIGPDVGGAINIICELATDAPFLGEFFPPIVYEMAKARRGMFLFDAGVLYDPKTKKNYFTEFAGNRWGWGGVFSELSMAHRNGKVPSMYFQKVASGENPFRYEYGCCVSMYNLKADSRFPRLVKGDLPVYFTKDAPHEQIYMQQIRSRGGITVNVGDSDYDAALGFVSGYGNTIEGTLRRAYSALENVSFEGMVYRCFEDFMSEAYTSAPLRRLRVFQELYY